MHLATLRGFAPRRLVVSVAVVALLALAALAGRAQAAETVYWNNYSSDPDSIAFAGIDGAGGGPLNLGSATLSSPEGMAYDTATNRLFVASSSDDRIVAIDLDGSGGVDFSAPGAPIDSPDGLVIDPDARRVYWINAEPDTISWALLDGSAGGVVDTGGAKVNAYRLSLDPVAQRLYWFDGTGGTIHSVSSAGGAVVPLNTTGATPGPSSSGVAVEPGLGKVFWLNDNDAAVSWASLAGTGGGDLPVTAPAIESPYGLAVDAAASRIYWANYGAGETRTNALGFLNLSGGFAPINVLTAPVKGPQDPVVIKPPAATAAPAISRGTKAARSRLACSTGDWAADAPGAFVYQAPRSLAYQWLRDGKAIAGATAATLIAKSAGKYTCTVTAANQAGSAAKSSAVAKVEASKAKLTTKKKVIVKAGGTATFTLKIANQGDLKSKNAKLCVILPKAAKGALRAAKPCKALGKLKGRGKKSAKLKIKALPSASGVYAVSFKVKGTAGKAAKAKIAVR